MTTPEKNIPYGYCQCGCGQKTNIATQTSHTYGWINGEPKLFIHGHNRRGAIAGPESVARMSAARIRHGKSRQLVPRSRVYVIWSSMKARCLNTNNHAYEDYGGRGIKVCKRWMTFENFLADMGEPPERMTIERRNNDGDYSPENCYWATFVQQANNRRGNRIIELDGIRYTLSQISGKCGLNRHTISDRIDRGWTVEDAVSIPSGAKRC